MIIILGGLQRMALASISLPKHCLIITFWKHQTTYKIAPFLLSGIFYFANRLPLKWKHLCCWTIIPTTTGMIEPLSCLTMNHWFILHLFNFKREHASPLLHLHSLLQALWRPTEQRDGKWSTETRQPSTRLEPIPPTHTHICTDAPKPPGSPICFLTCHSQRCFSASLTTDYSPHFQPAET